jgi:hypothetical protein
MTNNSNVIVGGRGFFSWWNDLWNNWFGSKYGYTDTVKLGGKRLKTRKSRKTRKNKTNKSKF